MASAAGPEIVQVQVASSHWAGQFSHPDSAKPITRWCGLSHSLGALLFATALPVASPALAEDTQSQPAAAQEPASAPGPTLAPSMTGPLHANPNPLHVDGGPLGP